MNKLLLVGLGGLGLFLFASKGQAQEEPKPPKPSPSPKPSTPKPSPSPKPAPPASSDVNVPLQVVQNLLKGIGSPEGQVVWLRENGFPNTAAVLDLYIQGEASASELLNAATTEGLTAAAAPTKGSPIMDEFGAAIVARGNVDEIYNYCIDSKSIPLVRDAAAELALKGDTRAMELTQRLAWLST